MPNPLKFDENSSPTFVSEIC